jgi:hypothetical protein
MDDTVINKDPRSLKSGGHLSAKGIFIVPSPIFFGRTFIVDGDRGRIGDTILRFFREEEVS